MQPVITQGIHHLGLTVSKLEESANFFKSMLGWTEVKRKHDYPAIFVSDGTIMLTLWGTQKEPVARFDKDRNVGLHHVALCVREEAVLNEAHERLLMSGVPIEFGPELLGPGPAKHMMFYEPSGMRIELIWPGK